MDSAETFLYWASRERHPDAVFDGMRPEPRDLTRAEEEVYDAALEVLRAYFAGEKDFGDNAPASTQPIPDPAATPKPVLIVPGVGCG